MIGIEVLGWTGAVAVLVAYALLTAGRLRERSNWYLALNVGGSAGLAVNALVHGAWPSVVLNLLWLSIALFGAWRRRLH
jgi:hypothetical protein